MIANWKSEKQANTISEGVYFALRKNILDMKLKPGTKISIKELAELFEVSRSPVRDAIIKLVNEGLVDSIPQVGTMVSCINLKKVEEERFLRECLEEKIILLFVEIYNKHHIKELKEMVEKMKKSYEQGDYVSAINADDGFHDIFFKAVDKKLCLETMRAISGHYRRIRLMSSWDSEISECVIEQHSEIIELIESKNKEEVLRKITEHCRAIINQEKRLLVKFPEYFYIESDKENYLKNDFLSIFV